MTNYDFSISAEKLNRPFSNNLNDPKIFTFFKLILQKEKRFFTATIIYGIFIALLSLALPISVQLLINSVAFTALLQPVIILGLVLFMLLAFSTALNSLQVYITEMFQRHFFSRFSFEIVNKLIYANHRQFEESNQTEFINRFFDVVNVQKTVPKILTKTFTLMLQSIVGLILVAFYHPALLILSFSIIVATYLVWNYFARSSFVKKFHTSKRKYDMASWFEDIARNNILFKSQIGQAYAKFKTNFIANQYLTERKQYFQQMFWQVTLTFALCALGNAILLIAGGYLVVKGQLSLGQLVASEFIMSVVLYNIAQLGREFEYFYELGSSCEKLSQFYNIPSEKNNKHLQQLPEDFTINFEAVNVNYFQRQFNFNICFTAGKKYLLTTENLSAQKLLIELMFSLYKPDSGSIEIGNCNIDNLDIYQLRNKIAIIDNGSFIDGTVYEYLTFNNSKISSKKVNEVLEAVGINQALNRFNSNVSLQLIPSGWPFSESEKIMLRVAKAMISEPKIIIISEVLDMLTLKMRNQILQFISTTNTTLLYFSNRRDHMIDFDQYLFVGSQKTLIFNTIDDLTKFEEKTYG